MKTQILLLMMVLSLGLAGCGQKNPAHTQAEDAATEAALAWLKLIDDGNYAESWEQSAASFKNATTAEKWAAMVKPIQSPLGKVQSREVANRDYMTSLPNAPKGEYVIIQFKTNFENKKGAVETVTPMLEDGKWKVSGYFIK
jgi:ABC-type glycerol-3-phosphate transport system substrate-binding protein